MEQIETVLEHLYGDQRFTVTCGEQWSCNRIRKLREEYPDDVEIVTENKDGSLVAHIPSKWVRITPPRKMNLSDERRAALSEQGKRLAESRAKAYERD